MDNENSWLTEVTSIEMNHEVMASYDKQIEMAEQQGNVELTAFLKQQKEYTELMVQVLAEVVPYMELSDNGLRQAVAVIRHMQNDWDVCSDIPISQAMSDEATEALNRLTMVLEARNEFDKKNRKNF